MPSGEGFAEARVGDGAVQWPNGLLPNLGASRGHRAGAAGDAKDAGNGRHEGSWNRAAVFGRSPVSQTGEHRPGRRGVRGSDEKVIV